MKRALWVTSIGALIGLLGAASNGSAQGLEDFGYNRMPASGGRPLLVILTEFEGSPPLRYTDTALVKPDGTPVTARDYFDDLAFNPSGSPENPSLTTYYQEISNGRFWWVPAGTGVVGPYHFTPGEFGTEINGQLTRLTLALKAAANDGVDFGQFDQNGDGTVTTNELGILVIDNYVPGGVGLTYSAANRASDPMCFAPDGQQVTLCLRGAMAGHYASFLSIAHELLHSLGAYDLYGASQNLSTGYTAMGSTPATAPQTWHLDPFHKIQFGWVEPRLRSIHVAGSVTIGAAHLVQDDRPVILYSPYDLREYFILEHRTTAVAGGGGYDADLPGNGLVIWQVATNASGVPLVIPSLTNPGGQDRAVFTLGSPSMQRGMGTAWSAAPTTIFGANAYVIPYTLRWLGGVDSGVQIEVGAASDDGTGLRVSWGTFHEDLQPQSRDIVYFSGLWALGDIGRFGSDGSHSVVSTFSVDYSGYSHVVADQAGLFYYNASNGRALLANVDAAGTHTVVTKFAPGYFGAGWTHIVSHRGYVFFYSAGNGMAAIGTLSASGFRQYRFYPAGSFGTGWTHIVSTQNGLLFYASGNGMGAVGDWDYVYAPCSGWCFPTITDVRFRTFSWFPAGSFAPGWSTILETGSGVLFYRKSDGLLVMVDVLIDGRVVTRGHSFATIKAGYTAAVDLGGRLLFYDSSTGDGAVAEVLAADPWVYSGSVGTLRVLAEWSGYFASGWSHLVTMTPAQSVH